MKRFLLALAGVLLLHVSAFAQLDRSSQRGRATHDMRAEGLCAAHNNIPLDSKVRVVNIANGKEVEVTITGRIPISPNRIIDLSPAAWEELELGRYPGAEIMLHYSRTRAPVQPITGEPAKPEEPEEISVEIGEETPVETTPPDSQAAFYHLLVLDRIRSVLDADIGNESEVETLYKFKHGRNGYIIALYATKEKTLPVTFPAGSRALVNIVSTQKAAIRKYVNSGEFRRYVTSRQVLPRMQRVLAAEGGSVPPITEEFTEPEEPVEPETPAGIAEPEAPVKPETPAEIAEPEAPVKPETPAEIAEPEEPVKPETPAEIAEPEAPVKPETPAEIAEPEEPVEPEESEDTEEPPEPEEIPVEITAQTPGETAPWGFQPIFYHLLVLDRRHCYLDADIGNESEVMTLYKFKHGGDGYLIAVYTSKEETSPVTLPAGSRVLAAKTATHKSVIREYVNSGEFRQFVSNRQVLPQIRRALADEIVKIIPALPSPFSGKIYRLQVGAFASPETADEVLLRLGDAGFETGMEEYGSLIRVFVTGIRAADVYLATQRLGAAGFSEIWVRE